MLVTGITLVVITALVLIFLKKHFKLNGFECFVVIFLSTTILSLPVNMIPNVFLSEKKEVTYIDKIVATKAGTRLNGELHGSMFYVRGTIDEVDYYFYLVKRNGVYKQGKVEVNNTVIKETNGTPHVKRVKKYTIYNINQKIVFRLLHDSLDEERDTLFVPVGTIEKVSDYNVF